MKHLPHSQPARIALTGILVSLMLFVAGCSGGSGSDSSPTSAGPATTIGPDIKGSTPKPTLSAAVEALLTAEQAGDHASSYKLLDAAGRAKFADVSDWTNRRTQVAPITKFTIDDKATKPTSIIAIVEHTPALDPFVGLSAAKERQTWEGAQTKGGFLVDPEPSFELVLPPESTIAKTVQDWAVAVQACDEKRAAPFQAIDVLYGASVGASKLCGSKTPIKVGAVQPLAPGPSSADLVSQYSSDVLTWARTVTVSGPADFTVVLAPWADGWKVLGAID